MMERICKLEELMPLQGCGALIGDEQVALFLVPHTEQKVFAVQNWDPIGQANVISRGIVGDVKGELCVASPLYKQHFNLETGQCIEKPDVRLKTYSVCIKDAVVFLTKVTHPYSLTC